MHALLLKVVTSVVLAGLLGAIAWAAPEPAVTVTARHGRSWRGEVDGFPVLVLRGTHRQRGEAHGYLAAKEVLRTCDAMAATVNRMGDAGKETGWKQAKKLVSRFKCPSRYREELEGMLSGIVQALPDPAARRLQATGAEVTLDDLFVLQCGDVLELMRCSQFSAWGSLTPDGATVIGRNWDYPPIFPFDTYCVFAVEPAEKGLQRTLDAMWFGMLGAGMACLNEEGVYISGNDGGSENPNAIPSPTPVMLAGRTTAETAGSNNALAVVEQNINQKTALALLYHIVAPPGKRGQGEQAFIFEYVPGAAAAFATRLRRVSPALPEALIVTNHPLLSGAGAGGSLTRFTCIEQALSDPQAKGKVDFEKTRSILDSVAASSPGLTTQYSAVVWPGRREMRVAVAPEPGQTATRQRYVLIQWETLFGRR